MIWEISDHRTETQVLQLVIQLSWQNCSGSWKPTPLNPIPKVWSAQLSAFLWSKPLCNISDSYYHPFLLQSRDEHRILEATAGRSTPVSCWQFTLVRANGPSKCCLQIYERTDTSNFKPGLLLQFGSFVLFLPLPIKNQRQQYNCTGRLRFYTKQTGFTPN